MCSMLSVLHSLRGLVGELGFCSSWRHRETLFFGADGSARSSLLVGPSGEGLGEASAWCSMLVWCVLWCALLVITEE